MNFAFFGGESFSAFAYPELTLNYSFPMSGGHSLTLKNHFPLLENHFSMLAIDFLMLVNHLPTLENALPALAKHLPTLGNDSLRSANNFLMLVNHLPTLLQHGLAGNISISVPVSILNQPGIVSEINNILTF